MCFAKQYSFLNVVLEIYRSDFNMLNKFGIIKLEIYFLKRIFLLDTLIEVNIYTIMHLK